MGSNDALGHFCSRSLVGSKYVVTAAHCVKSITKEDLKVALRFNSMATMKRKVQEGTVLLMGVSRITKHPWYSHSRNDILVLELQESLNLTSCPNIKPICLPLSAVSVENSQGWVSGLGTIHGGFIVT